MKIVGVSQGVEYIEDRKEIRDFSDQKLIQFLVASGLLPVPVPNFNKETARDNSIPRISISEWINEISPAGLLLSGGSDVGTFVSRDFTEESLLGHAFKRELPVLGICRGMQMMAIWGGASLYSVTGHAGTRHLLSGEMCREVNSYHHKALKSCPNHFEVIARCPQGEIEAIRHKELPWEGWMWHPEREDVFCTSDIKNIRSLFNRN